MVWIKKKAWKDIWGCGQGIGAVKNILSCKEFVDKLIKEYTEAKSRLNKNCLIIIYFSF